MHKLSTDIASQVAYQFLKLSCGLLLTIYLASSFTKTTYGEYVYLLANFSIYYSLVGFGSKALIVKYFSEQNNQRNKMIMTAVLIYFISALIFIILFYFSAIYLFSPRDLSNYYTTGVILLGIIYFWKVGEVFESLLESTHEFKVINKLKSFVIIFSTGIKILFLQYNSSYIPIITITCFEFFALAGGLIILSQSANFKKILTFSFIDLKTVSRLAKKSFPIACSAAAVVIYQKTDQIMLGQFLSSDAVAEYSVGIRISEALIAFPSVITAAIFPLIVKIREKSLSHYSSLFSSILCLGFYAGASISIVLFVFSDHIISYLFPDYYYDSATIMKIHCFTLPFIFFGVFSGSYLILEEIRYFIFIRTVCGALLNLLLNFVLIPHYEGIGAAIATLMAQIFATFLVDGFYSKTRNLFFAKFRALNFLLLPRSFRDYIRFGVLNDKSFV